ncbi:MAG: RNA methyltransferase [Deltaproteobacteria bacterium]|nr:RNA methyltransferase [Deltaproteobacteria bacterium]
MGPNVYLAQTQPGFEGVAWEEIRAKISAAFEPPSAGVQKSRSRAVASLRELGRRNLPERAGITIFTAPRPERLRLLRASDDIFALVGYVHRLPADSGALERVSNIARQTPYIDHALATRTRLMPGTRSGHRLRYRVIARMAGENEFRRADIARAVSRGLAERRDHSWRPSPEEADVEFWATLLAHEFILAIRLSDQRMRHREYKLAHLPGSLRPSVAAALALLSDPAREDIVLDPFCGTGTVLVERAHVGRYAMLIGCDRDPDALSAAQKNVGPRYKPLELRQWDALALPLPDHSVSKIVTNLPWGLRYGSHEENRRVYPQVLQEFHRLVSPGGKIVILTGEVRLMSDLAKRGALRPDKVLQVSILGTRAAVYISSVPP